MAPARCRITKAAHSQTHARTRTLTTTHARALTYAPAHIHKYIILTALSLQQWFSERTSLLRYTYIACLVTRHFDQPRRADGGNCLRITLSNEAY